MGKREREKYTNFSFIRFNGLDCSINGVARRVFQKYSPNRPLSRRHSKQSMKILFFFFPRFSSTRRKRCPFPIFRQTPIGFHGAAQSDTGFPVRWIKIARWSVTPKQRGILSIYVRRHTAAQIAIRRPKIVFEVCIRREPIVGSIEWLLIRQSTRNYNFFLCNNNRRCL